MERNAAAEEFAKMLYQEGIEEALRAFYDLLDNPTGPQKRLWQQAKDWHASHTEERKALIRFLFKEAMVAAIFKVAVHFDGASGYEYVGERPAEFAVALQIYNNLDEAEEGNPQEIIAICPNPGGTDVHDLFLSFVDESY